ncbi:MAG: Ni/Fe-hydrogenase, b-type cytochrome subunit [Candidatus Acidiferrales bacterium]
MKKTRRRHGHEAEWKKPAYGQVRVYVWEWPVRFAHWIIFTTIVSLSITGYYMHSPFVVPHGRTAYVMGTMRFVHLVSGFAFLGAVVIRVVWMFIGNQWSHWDQFIPTTKKRLKDLADTGRYYGFMTWSSTPQIGHNAMAGAAYAAVFAMAFVEILTGFALYSRILGSSWLNFFIGWVPHLIDIQWLRLIHFLTMFGFWMFFIHHLYTAILVSIEEENGVMESIFSGYKFVPEHELREVLEAERSEDLGPRVEEIRPSPVGGQNSQSRG